MPISATTRILRRFLQWGSSVLLLLGLAFSPALAQETEISITPPEVLDFGRVVVGSAVTSDVIIENTGEVDVDIFNIETISGETGEQGFVIVDGGGEPTLEPGDMHTVTIEFAPDTSGFKAEDLVIDYSPGENRGRIDLRGFGVVPPTATTTEASSVTATSAVLNGDVNTGRGETTVTFEYGISSEGLTESVEAEDSPIVEAQSVRAPIDGLEPATEYVFRVVANNAAGSDAGEQASFTTGDAAPSARTDPADDVATTSATLRGSVDPNGRETTVTFEYGLTADYGGTITAAESPLSGGETQAVSATLDELDPGTTYHYRVVAENALGSTNGGDQMFTTSAPVLAVNPSEVSFGEVGLGNSSAPQEVTIENAGDATLSIATVTLGDTTNFKKQSDTGETNLPPGSTRTLTLTFVPQSSGARTTELVVESETAGTAAVSLSGRGVQLGIAVVPDTLDLGTVAVGDTATGQMTIENTGEGTLEIAGTSLSGSEAGDFAVISGGESGTLEPGAARSVTIQFMPSREGSRMATMTVESNADPANAELRGTGEAVPPSATTQAATSVRTMTATVNGRVHPGGGTTTVTFEYEPTGGSTQTIEADQSPVAGAEEVEVSAEVEGLEPGTEYVFRVVASNSAGSDMGADQSFTTLAPEMTVEPSNLDFGRAAVDDTTTGQVVLENTGNADLEITNVSITGSNAESFSMVGDGPGGILPGQEQALIIRFIPSSGGAKTAQLALESNAGSANVDLSGEAVAVEVDLNELDPTSGEPEEVVGTIPESFQPTERTLYYRRGGEQVYESVELSLENGGRITGSIPASAVTPRGIDFYIELSDGELTLTAPPAQPAADPFHVRTQFEGFGAAGEFAPRTYRMISVPSEVAESDIRSVFSAYGAINPSQWRLLRWNPSVESYQEGTDTGPVAPGHAFWLITRSGEGFSVSGRSVDASESFELTLEPGWNQIAVPFAFPVAWSQGEVPSGVDAPRAAHPPHSEVSVLEPWQGYWVFNRNASPVEMSVPPVETSETAGTVASRARAKDLALPFAEPPAYALQLIARYDRGQKEEDASTQELRDRGNYVGWTEGANPGFGAEDIAEVPPIGEYVRLSVIEDETRLAGSLRPTGGDGQAWNLEVAARVEEPFFRRKTVTVQLRDHGTRPSDYELELIDQDNGRTIPIQNNQFTVTLTSDQSARHLRLVVGAPHFADQETASVAPRATLLGPGYPNPSSGAVSVDYQLEEARHVQIAVYDMLGRRMQTLVDRRQSAGRHTARWNGRRVRGTPAASGVYVIRMQAESFTATRRIVLVR